MADRLQEARRALHNSMHAQAVDRAARTLRGHSGFQPGPGGHVDSGFNPAQYQRAAGNTGQAVTDWEAHHPGAMSKGQIPGWISNFLQNKVNAVSAGPGFPSQLSALPGAHSHPVMPGDVVSSGQIHGFGPGGVVNSGGGTNSGSPVPAAPVAAAHAAEQFPTSGSNFPSELLHLGGGVYLHPPTGTIFGGGDPSGVMNAMTTALHSVSGGPAAPAAGPFKAV